MIRGAKRFSRMWDTSWLIILVEEPCDRFPRYCVFRRRSCRSEYLLQRTSSLHSQPQSQFAHSDDPVMHLLHFSEVSRFNFVLYVIGLSSTLLSHSGHLPARHPHLPTLLLHRHAGESARRPLFASRRLRAPRRSRGSIRDGVSSRSLSHRRTRARTARSFSPRTSGLVFSASLAAWSPASVSRRSSGRCSRRPNDPPPSSSRATSPRAGSPDSSRGTRLRISPYF